MFSQILLRFGLEIIQCGLTHDDPAAIGFSASPNFLQAC